jgi:hypothetical protein
VVAASSGWPQPGWTVLPNQSVLAVDRVTLTTSVFGLESVPQHSGLGRAGPSVIWLPLP